MNILRLLGCFSICFSPVLINTLVRIQSDTTWYQNLIKPNFTPPSWVFAPIWTIIYTLMTISLFLFWNSNYDFSRKKWGTIFFTLQLILNAIYTPIFFGQKSLEGGFIITILLAVTLIFTIIEFYKISKLSAYLLLPYLMWGCFAIALSQNILILNQ